MAERTINCTYREEPVPLGRARTRCPACGAALQTDQPDDVHYKPPRKRRQKCNLCGKMFDRIDGWSRCASCRDRAKERTR